MRWGFLPGFVKDPKDYPLVFNIRSESLLEKPSFRTAIKRRRCLFPADAFYEWQRVGTRKGDSRPHLLRRRDGALLAFAGLYETWVGPNGEEVDTAAIITTAASDATAVLHPRLPAMLDKENFDIWLDSDEQRTERALELLRPPQYDALEFFAIGPAINKADNDSIEVQQPATAQDPTPVQGSLF